MKIIVPILSLLLLLFLAACGDDAGSSCSGPGDCSAGVCLTLTCNNGKISDRCPRGRCGSGNTCQQGDLPAVISSTGECWCVPASVCN